MVPMQPAFAKGMCWSKQWWLTHLLSNRQHCIFLMVTRMIFYFVKRTTLCSSSDAPIILHTSWDLIQIIFWAHHTLCTLSSPVPHTHLSLRLHYLTHGIMCYPTPPCLCICCFPCPGTLIILLVLKDTTPLLVTFYYLYAFLIYFFAEIYELLKGKGHIILVFVSSLVPGS